MIKIDYMNTSSQRTAHDQENQRLLRDSRKEMEFLIEKLLYSLSLAKSSVVF